MDTCGPCKFRNEDKKATKYCLTCQEPQCKTCAEIHGSSKATRNHLLLKVTDLRNASKTNEDLERFQNCHEHPEKKLEFFCVDHDHFICSTCLLNIHKLDCKTVVDIETAGEQLAANNFIEQLTHDLESVIDHCEEGEKTMQSLIDRSQKKRRGLEKYMNDFEHKVLEELNKCKKDILDEMDKHVKTQTAELSCQQNLFKETSQTAKENKDVLENIISNHSKADMFRCAFSIMQQLNAYQSNKDTGCIDLFAHSVNVSPAFNTLVESIDTEPIMQCRRTITKSKRLTSNVDFKAINDSFLKSTKQVALKRDSDTSNDYACSSADAEMEDDSETRTGTLSTIANECVIKTDSDTLPNLLYSKSDNTKDDDEVIAKDNKAEMKPAVHNKPRHTEEETTVDNALETSGNQTIPKLMQVSNIRILTPTDISPIIDGVTTLYDGRLVLSDKAASRLIILKRNFTYDHELAFREPPGSLTALTLESLAVCFPTTNTVTVLSIDTKLKPLGGFTTKYSPVGIHAIDKNRLFVASVDNKKSWYLNVLTPKGAVIVTVKNTQSVLDAKHISTFKLKNEFRYYLYCCNISGCVYCVQADGKDIFRYNVKSPNGLYVDEAGYIYVVDFSGTLHILSTNGELLQKVPIHAGANGITYYPGLDRLVISKQSESEISVYTVKQ